MGIRLGCYEGDCINGVGKTSYSPSEDYSGEFKNGLEHGSHKEWYDNGQLKKERIYNNGIKTSTKTWDKEGNITTDVKH